MVHQFPFTAIVGHDEFKLALQLCIIDPTLGGVLAMGDKGTGKTTLVRSLAHLMKDEAHSFPFVNLPIGVAEDRLLGSVDIEQLINNKRQVVQAGLLAQAHQGILYIDEVNLLNDYLMDVLLDAAATGSYHLEREGISLNLDSRFCLIGTMNPEEGDLRPQLKDRFGLSVDITTPVDIKIRANITAKRLAFDTDAEGFIDKCAADEAKLRQRLTKARSSFKDVHVAESILETVAALTVAHQVEGMRADILIIKAARAYAAFLGDKEVEPSHVDEVAMLVLRHRSKNPDNNHQKNDSSPQEGEQEKKFKAI